MTSKVNSSGFLNVKALGWSIVKVSLLAYSEQYMEAINWNDVLIEGKRVLQLEAEAILTAAGRLDSSFVDTVKIIYTQLRAGGKIVVSGVGKSGNVAQKLAATLTSTGSMAVFLHPTEALHGDLGILGPNDVFLLFSHSGSTAEILYILPTVRELCSNVIAILGNKNGVLAQHADVVIEANIPMEACPNNLAPTTSSTLQMALGDAIAMCLQRISGFDEQRFARIHPGGKLGKQILTRVSDIMHKMGKMALLAPDASMEDVVIALTNYRHSGVCIIEGDSERPKLVGVITEGDIRRALFSKEKFFDLRAADIMTKNATTVTPETKAAEALRIMENRESQLSFLPVVDEMGFCVGVLRLHDVVLAGLS